MKMNKAALLMIPVVVVAAVAAGCSNDAQHETDSIIDQYVNYTEGDFYTPWQSESFTQIHLNGSSIQADGANVAALVIEDQTITIKGAGTYVIEGTLSDGQVIVDTEESGTVRIVLNGVDITSSTSAPIFVKQSDKTVLSLEEGTTNQLTDGNSRSESDVAAATLYSKDDLTINGGGTLNVQANAADGIAAKDDLLITGGNITIQAADDGILGRDVLAIQNATISIDAQGDGMKSTNDEKDDKGHIVLESGTITINAAQDGIASVNELVVLDGKYEIKSGGGSPETVESGGDFGGGMPGGNFGDFNPADLQEMIDSGELPEGMTMPNGTPPTQDGAAEGNMTPPNNGQMPNGTPPTQDNATEVNTTASNNNGESDEQQRPAPPSTNEDGQSAPATQQQTDAEGEQADSTPSTKGLKATKGLTIYGGTFDIDSLDDALHSDASLTIAGGDITVNTGDDGVHADNKLFITDGNITVLKSYEGLEGKNISIEGGHTEVTAADDGVNINGGSANNEFEQIPNANTTASQSREATDETAEDKSDEESLLSISGGYLLVNAQGDGLDSNGSIKMTDGTAIIYGPTASMNGSLDYDGTFDLQGGTLIAAGSSGMALGVSDSSTQNTVMMTFEETLEVSTTVSVTNATGDVLLAVQPPKSFQSIVISSPELAVEDELAIGYGGTLKGKLENGVTTDATIEGITAKTAFSFDSTLMYLNQDGITSAPTGFGGMGGPGQGGNMQNNNGGQPPARPGQNRTDTSE